MTSFFRSRTLPISVLKPKLRSRPVLVSVLVSKKFRDLGLGLGWVGLDYSPASRFENEGISKKIGFPLIIPRQTVKREAIYKEKKRSSAQLQFTSIHEYFCSKFAAKDRFCGSDVFWRALARITGLPSSANKWLRNTFCRDALRLLMRALSLKQPWPTMRN